MRNAQHDYQPQQPSTQQLEIKITRKQNEDYRTYRWNELGKHHHLLRNFEQRNCKSARRIPQRNVPQIEKEIRIPILHIADATANCIKRDNIKKVALLGTKFTMTQDFIKNRIIEAGLEVMTPDAQDIELVNDVIFNELCLGKILDSSRKEYQRIITEMKNRDAEGVILGCTEIGMLISAKDSVLPTYDTTIIHATEAAKMALE